MLTESCIINYCQDGLNVYFATETHDYPLEKIYGHYALQSFYINGRPYFKKSVLGGYGGDGGYGVWWNGLDLWHIGYDLDKGQSYGFAEFAIGMEG